MTEDKPVVPSRPFNREERRRKLAEIYRALSPEKRDEVDVDSRRSAEHQARMKGLGPESALWSCEVARLRDAIRDRSLAPVEWQEQDAADRLKASILEDAKRVSAKPRKAKRAVRGGKDASIGREADA